MTGDETEVALRLLTGHWPRPALTEAETAVWMRTLSARRLDLSVTVIDRIAATGATWRPTDGEFLAAYRQALGRETKPPVDRSAPALAPGIDDFEGMGPPPDCGHAGGALACRETTEYWLARCRAQIAAAGGPLFRGAGAGAVAGGRTR